MATIAGSSGPSMKLQIYVDKKSNRVVFAEAKKDFVDFIFHILSLPLGAVQRILSNTPSILGSIGTLQEGLKNLDYDYTEIHGKDYLLDLKAPYWGKNTCFLLPEATSYSVFESLWSVYNKLASNNTNSVCNELMKGYVKELVTFIVTDDLVVRPAEPTSFISLMNQHSIKDVRAIEKREVTFSDSQAIHMLQASVSSKTVLTDVFLTKWSNQGGSLIYRECQECSPIFS